MSKVVGILLAAGSSSRFGSNKLLHSLPDGTPIGVAAARNLLEALPNSIAVVPPSNQELRAAFVELGMQVVENQHTSKGMSSSIIVGINASLDADGWVIALADMPWVKAETIHALVDHLKGGDSIVAPEYKGRRGNPVGFSSVWKEELLKLAADKGAKGLLVEYRNHLNKIQTEDDAIFRDIDTKLDLY